MAESQTEDDGISTVNTNAHIVRDQRERKYADHERMILMRGIRETHDITVMVNRITDKYGGVTGIEKVDTHVYMVYCDNR